MPTPWLTDSRPEWLAEATRWIDEAAASSGIGAVVDVTSVREEPWSAVLRVTTSDRVAYFKAEGLGGAHEPALIADLATRWPHVAPTILHMDAERPWFLMDDDGKQMREVLDDAEQVDLFEKLLPEYAQMQIESSALVERWIALGVPDRRLTDAPAKLERLLSGPAIGAAELPLAADQRDAIRALVPEFTDVCAELDAVPAALDHGDLHSGNVLVKGAEHRVIDWGDACITHPFCSLFVTFQLAIPWLKSVDKSAVARRLRDAYLDAWGAGRETFAKALWAGHVTRGFDFVHMLDGMDEKTAAQWNGYIAEILVQWSERYELLADGDAIIDAIVNADIGGHD